MRGARPEYGASTAKLNQFYVAKVRRLRSTAKTYEQENARRCDGLDQIEWQFTRERAEAERLRNEIAAARAEQNRPKVATGELGSDRTSPIRKGRRLSRK